jgi:predicted TIM-barrel fold metal-dependent hydrolase
MIIDCHTHIGNILNFDMKKNELLESMDKYQVDFALVSNIEAAEFNHDQKRDVLKNEFNQINTAEKVISLAKEYPSKIGALIWIRPNLEEVTDEFVQFIEENREYIYGFKVHPFYSKLAFNDERMIPYIETAAKFELPIVTHTAIPCVYSDSKYVHEMAMRYSQVNFVLYHMDMTSENDQAIEFIKTTPNLYGDVAWVKPENMLKAIKACGKDKIMFGTDNPISGSDTYGRIDVYEYCFTDMKNDLTTNEYEHFMYKNAMKLFKKNPNC